MRPSNCQLMRKAGGTQLRSPCDGRCEYHTTAATQGWGWNLIRADLVGSEYNWTKSQAKIKLNSADPIKKATSYHSHLPT